MDNGQETTQEEPAGGAEKTTPPADFVDPVVADTPLADATIGALITTLQASSISYSGPMPPSSEFEAYEQILPGTAKVIRTMAVDEQKHRHDLENREMTLREREQEAAIHLNARGQWAALLVIIISAIVCLALVYMGEGGYGVAVVLFAIGTVAAVVAIGRFDPPWKRDSDQPTQPD